MSGQKGRGGMGSHKHAISGTPGMPPGLKQRLAREANSKKKKKAKTKMYSSVDELMKDR